MSDDAVRQCPEGCGAFDAENGALISDYEYHVLREHGMHP